jgi:hypothetical protein
MQNIVSEGSLLRPIDGAALEAGAECPASRRQNVLTERR